jgi:hypothetical protein
MKRGQLKLPIQREARPDRNLHLGGRSFYFFDFDDNVMFLPSQIYIFEKTTRREVALSTGHFAKISHLIGKPGMYESYVIDLDDETGSFRRFRDLPSEHLAGRPQFFVEDMEAALAKLDVEWKGPSWDFFEHAVHNGRPVALITARGHHPRTLEVGIERLLTEQHLTRAPSYLALYPVSHPETRRSLNDGGRLTRIPELKHVALVRCVEEAMRRYGENEHHRFGVSDDSPENIEVAVAAFTELKRRFPKNAFFVFDSSQDPIVSIEVETSGTRATTHSRDDQLALF